MGRGKVRYVRRKSLKISWIRKCNVIQPLHDKTVAEQEQRKS